MTTQTTLLRCFVVIKLHDDQSEGLSRQSIIRMIITASGDKLTHDQAARTWDRTVHPLGKQLGLLTGYVRPQDGTSKRTAAGSVELQKKWYGTITELLSRIEDRASKVLCDADLVKDFMPRLIANLDEECLHALGKNAKIVGSRAKSKHDNQNATSRCACIYDNACLPLI